MLRQLVIKLPLVRLCLLLFTCCILIFRSKTTGQRTCFITTHSLHRSLPSFTKALPMGRISSPSRAILNQLTLATCGRSLAIDRFVCGPPGVVAPRPNYFLPWLHPVESYHLERVHHQASQPFFSNQHRKNSSLSMTDQTSWSLFLRLPLRPPGVSFNCSTPPMTI